MSNVIPVVCAVILKDNKVLLTQRDDPANEYHLFWNLPGGCIDFGETNEQALIREVKEEAGFDIEVKEMIPTTHNNMVKIAGELKHFMLVGYHCTIKNNSTGMAGHETAALKWFPLNSLPDNMTPGTEAFIRFLVDKDDNN